ncbi:hypothetical protein MTO96_048430 [Rhipicephalus appendiculatus]
MPSLADAAAATSGTTTPVPAASLGPPLCSPDESVLESLVAVLVAAIIFLAALVLAVLLFACSSQQTRREPRCSHDHRHHHCSKRRRCRSLQEVRSRACCGGDRDEDVELFCDRRETTTAVCGPPRRSDYGSSAGRSSSPDDSATKKSPFHPGYNSPATTSRAPPPSRHREGFRKSRYASPGGARSDLASALHSTAFQSGVSRQLTRERRATPATAKPPGGDTSDSSRRSAETGSDTRSLEWDNFQPPLASTSWPSISELCTDESFSIAATDGSQQQQQQRRSLSTQREHWV